MQPSDEIENRVAEYDAAFWALDREIAEISKKLDAMAKANEEPEQLELFKC